MSTIPSKTILEEVTATAKAVSQRWHAFWFAPADPLMLGLIRILTGYMLLYNLAIWGTDLQAFFGADSLQPLSTITMFHQNDYIFSFLYWVSDEWLSTVHGVCLIVAAMLCLGVLTRVSSVMAFLITISYSQRVPVANFGLDQLLGMLCLYLAIGPSGASLSIDSLVRRWRLKRKGLSWQPPELSSARMTLRLIQIHVCIIYFWAGFAKLKGDSWWTGEAMWQVIANEEYQTTDLTWMAWVPWLPYLIAHVTVAWEVSFCAMVWNKRLRPIWLAMGTAMHFGIGAFLGMWTFGLIMTFPYFAFSDGKKWRRRLTLFQSVRAAEADDPPAAAPEEVEAPGAPEVIVTAAPLPTDDDYDPWAASEPFVEEPVGTPEVDDRTIAAPLAQAQPEPTVAESIAPSTADVVPPAAAPLLQHVERVKQPAPEPETPIPAVPPEPVAPVTVAEKQTTAETPNAIETPKPSEILQEKVSKATAAPAQSDAAQELFRQTMGISAEPVRLKPARPRRLHWSSSFRADLQFAADEEDAADNDAEPFPIDPDEEMIMGDDHIMMGEPAPTESMVYAASPSGLLDSATPYDEEEDEPNHVEPAAWRASSHDDTLTNNPDQPDHFYSGATMSETNEPNPEANDSPDASHVLTTSKRMDRIKPKTANSLTGAPPPQVDGRVEDSVLAPETEVLLIAVHAPERNTFRTYLRRHDIPCRAAVSAENAVSVVLGMKPAAVLISGSMMNPEEIITLVDDLSDMVDSPILALLTGSQIKLLSNDPLSAHVLQYPASLRQIRSELTGILLEEGNARPRCSLRSAMMND